MKITRKEFKELVALYELTERKFSEACMYVNEEWLDNMVYPIFDWIERKLKIDEAHTGTNLLIRAVDDGADVEWLIQEEDGKIEEVNVKKSRNLDKIFDVYLKGVEDRDV